MTASDAAPQPVALLDDERVSHVDVGGLRLCVREWGPPDAPVVLLLHGLRGYSGTWRGLARALRADYRVIAIDARGRADSDWDAGRNYYTDAYLADVEAVVEKLGLGRFVLVGHSMGGTVAYVYADRHPERIAALVIEDIAPGSSISGAGAARIVNEMASLPLDFATWADAWRYWRGRRSSLPDTAIEERLFESLRAGEDGRIGWRYDAAGIAATRIAPDPARVVDLWPAVERLRMPTLLIRGQQSDFCPIATVEQMIARNPRIAAITVPGATHYVHDDAPDSFVEHVRNFLNSHLRPDHGTRAAFQE